MENISNHQMTKTNLIFKKNTNFVCLMMVPCAIIVYKLTNQNKLKLWKLKVENLIKYL